MGRKPKHPPSQTATEYAVQTGRAASTIRRWCIDGRIQGAWLDGKTWRIPLSAAEQFTPPKLGRPEGTTGIPLSSLGDTAKWLAKNTQPRLVPRASRPHHRENPDDTHNWFPRQQGTIMSCLTCGSWYRNGDEQEHVRLSYEECEGGS